MIIAVQFDKLDDDGKHLARFLRDRVGHAALSGLTLSVASGCYVWLKDKLTYGERIRRFGSEVPFEPGMNVPLSARNWTPEQWDEHLEKHIEAVETCYGTKNGGRAWHIPALNGPRLSDPRLSDAECVNNLGADLRRFCAVGEFEPAPVRHDRTVERAVTALFGGTMKPPLSEVASNEPDMISYLAEGDEILN